MDVQAVAGALAAHQRGEGRLEAVGVGDLAHHPLGQDEGVGRLLEGQGLELNLVLDHLPVAGEDVADLAVRVLQRYPHGGEAAQHLLADPLVLGERSRLLVAALLLDRVDRFGRVDEVVLELAEGLERHAGLPRQRLGGAAHHLLARVGQRRPVGRVERAEHVERAAFTEGVEERGAVPGHDVDVAGVGVCAGEDARAVHALAAGEHLAEVLAGVDGEGDGLEAPVAAHVAQVDLAQAQLLDRPDEVARGEVVRGLTEQPDEGVWFECIDGHTPLYQRYRVSASGARDGTAWRAERQNQWAASSSTAYPLPRITSCTRGAYTRRL